MGKDVYFMVIVIYIGKSVYFTVIVIYIGERVYFMVCTIRDTPPPPPTRKKVMVNESGYALSQQTVLPKDNDTYRAAYCLQELDT
jgi:hypothetical protein